MDEAAIPSKYTWRYPTDKTPWEHFIHGSTEILLQISKEFCRVEDRAATLGGTS